MIDISKIKSGDIVRYYPKGADDGLVCTVITNAPGTLMLRNGSDVYIINVPPPGVEVSEDKRAFIEFIREGEKKDAPDDTSILPSETSLQS